MKNEIDEMINIIDNSCNKLKQMKLCCYGLILLITIMSVTGCATQRYGRAVNVTETEKKQLSCKEVNIELAKAEEFLSDIRKQRLETNGAHVIGFLGDFGIGNAMEGNAAELSGENRLKQLRDLQSSKNCK